MEILAVLMKRWDDYCAGPGLAYEARVEPSEIGFLCNILEGHEGLAVLRTKDRRLGIVEFWITASAREDFESFIEGLKREIPITVGPPRQPPSRSEDVFPDV